MKAWSMPTIEAFVMHPTLVAAGLMVCPGCAVHREDGAP